MVPLIFNLLNCTSLNKKLPMLRIGIIFFERLGSANHSDKCVDEGVLQALWGVLYRAEDISKLEKKLVEHLVGVLSKDSVIFYLSSSKSQHLERYFSREGNSDYFDFCLVSNYMRARRRMAFLLRALRNRKINVLLVQNY